MSRRLRVTVTVTERPAGPRRFRTVVKFHPADQLRHGLCGPGETHGQDSTLAGAMRGAVEAVRRWREWAGEP